MIPKVLLIAGSDSGAGAGIQADLKTCQAHNVYATTCITAVTAQNSKEVRAVQNIDIIEQQIDAVIEDIGTYAVKIGMLSNKEIITIVTSSIKKHNLKNIVLDPVMIAASGAKLLQDDAIHALKTQLIPLADVLTPNIPEAQHLLNKKITNIDEMKQAAEEILHLGCKSVLMKGGHLEGSKITDYFSDGNLEFSHDKIDKEGHGTGCTLSSAIAANLAKGLSKQQAITNAIEYVNLALQQGFKVGEKNCVLNHQVNDSSL